MAQTPNLIGRQFSKLTVIEKLSTRDSFGRVLWKCKCKCGNSTVVSTNGLNSKSVQSCSCLRVDKNTIHGFYKSKSYRAWLSMFARIKRPSYQKNNIQICKRWNDVKQFIKDMGEPTKGMTLDRINNLDDYKPSNCRWASRTTQSVNRSTTNFLTYKGATLCVSHWAKEMKLSRSTINRRLAKGWSTEKTLTTPSRISK